MSLDRGNLPRVIQTDLNYFFLYDHKGTGSSRDVYTTELNKDWVVKVEYTETFQNVKEWELWKRLKDTTDGKWLAPCIAISPSGSILIQQKTTPASRYPKKLPRFLSDHKPENYGMIGNRFVCHDYGTHLMGEWGIPAMSKLRTVSWKDRD